MSSHILVAILLVMLLSSLNLKKSEKIRKVIKRMFDIRLNLVLPPSSALFFLSVLPLSFSFISASSSSSAFCLFQSSFLSFLPSHFSLSLLFPSSELFRFLFVSFSAFSLFFFLQLPPFSPVAPLAWTKER